MLSVIENHTDSRCILIQDALNYCDNMNVSDIVKRICFAEAAAYFENFVLSWDDVIFHKRPITQYLGIIVNALEIYSQQYPDTINMSTQCIEEIKKVIH